MPIQDLCFKNVVTISKDSTLADAAKRMKDEHVGVLVIADKSHRAVGIITDRDIVIGGLAEGKPASTKVSEVMTTEVLRVPKGTGVADVIEKMERWEVRRAVVVDKNDKPCGLISTDDLLQLLGDEMQSLGNLVSRQLSTEGLDKAA
ncbi:MAG: CBS domain-containing protein [Bdellovibrionota bacterium]